MDSRDFKVAVITVSDRAFSGERPDESGPELIGNLQELGYRVFDYILVPDEKSYLKKALVSLSETEKADLIITTGGTGLAMRDITPETTMEIATKTVPGIAEAIRAYSLTKTCHAMLSRGVAVLHERTLIINFPGSPKACRESLEAISQALPHALAMLRGEKPDP